MGIDPAPSDSGWVFTDCPECDHSLRISWPPDEPESIELLCRWCEEYVEIDREED